MVNVKPIDDKTLHLEYYMVRADIYKGTLFYVMGHYQVHTHVTVTYGDYSNVTFSQI
jgi:hypothetical protein